MRSSTAGVDPTVSATGWAADHRGDRARDGVPASCRSSGDAAAHVGKLHDDDVCHNVLGLYAVESEAGADSSPSPWARLPTGLRNGLARAEPRLRPPRPLRASSERNADDEPGLVRSWPNPGRARESVGGGAIGTIWRSSDRPVRRSRLLTPHPRAARRAPRASMGSASSRARVMSGLCVRSSSGPSLLRARAWLGATRSSRRPGAPGSRGATASRPPARRPPRASRGPRARG
jgi:hypothetical protein